MTAWLGLALLPLVGLLLVLTGWPAFVALIGAALAGMLVSVATGDVRHLTALPSRLVGLLESDILQALPLFVLMGALLNRLPLVEILFRTAMRLLRGGPAAPRVSALAIGALLAPMSGSVGASAMMLARAIRPRLAQTGVAPQDGFAVTAVASTLGVVVPPSLVLILLGDAMMGAHTIALNTAGRSGRVINTHDIFAGVLGPAALLLALAILIAAWPRGRRTAPAAATRPAFGREAASDLAVSALTVGFVAMVLGGVATGWFYAVEAAAAGAVILLAGGLASGRLRGGALADALAETLAVTGALFALLAAATTFTLVLRGLGTDRLLADGIAAIPSNSRVATLVVLAVVAASALVLDAFEIIFVIVPLAMPGLLVRVEDATWVAVLTLLTLQASFLLPPLGYAFVLARAALTEPIRPSVLVGALAPYLAASALTLGATLAVPALVHLGDRASPSTAEAPLSDREVLDRFNQLAPEAPPPFSPD